MKNMRTFTPSKQTNKKYHKMKTETIQNLTIAALGFASILIIAICSINGAGY